MRLTRILKEKYSKRKEESKPAAESTQARKAQLDHAVHPGAQNTRNKIPGVIESTSKQLLFKEALHDIARTHVSSCGVSENHRSFDSPKATLSTDSSEFTPQESIGDRERPSTFPTISSSPAYVLSSMDRLAKDAMSHLEKLLPPNCSSGRGAGDDTVVTQCDETGKSNTSLSVRRKMEALLSSKNHVYQIEPSNRKLLESLHMDLVPCSNEVAPENRVTVRSTLYKNSLPISEHEKLGPLDCAMFFTRSCTHCTSERPVKESSILLDLTKSPGNVPDRAYNGNKASTAKLDRTELLRIQSLPNANEEKTEPLEQYLPSSVSDDMEFHTSAVRSHLEDNNSVCEKQDDEVVLNQVLRQLDNCELSRSELSTTDLKVPLVLNLKTGQHRDDLSDVDESVELTEDDVSAISIQLDF